MSVPEAVPAHDPGQVRPAAVPPALGFCFDRSFPPAQVTGFARKLEADGLQQLWVIEDCGYTAGVSLASAALTVTDSLEVGLGILPAVARNPAITAMEIATLCGLGPGRVLPGIGHGVQGWMEQMGVLPRSPLTTLGEVITAVRRLLRGEQVSMDGQHVQLTDVRLDQPPAPVPPVLAGVGGPKSLAMAGQLADGLVLAEATGPTALRAAIDQAAAPDGFYVVVFATLCVARDRPTAYRRAAPALAGWLDRPPPSVRALSFYDELAARYARGGVEGLSQVPAQWWAELGAVGTIDDARAYVDALGAAGADSIAFLPEPDLGAAREQMDYAATLVG